jgi:zinc transport system substrate-binding protein
MGTVMSRQNAAGPKRFLFAPFFFLVLVSCAPRGGRETAPAGRPLIVVSMLPQGWFVSRVAGERARLLVLAGPGQNPHDWEPSPRQIAELSGAAAWILAGVEFEITLRPKIAALYPRLAIIDGVEGVRWRTLEEHEGDEHPDGGAEPDADGRDRHSWLGEEPAKIMARAIRDALSAADADYREQYAANCGAAIAEITAEFERLRETLRPLRGSTVFVYHPAFGYFLDEFGIAQAAVETGGKEPTPRLLAALVERARRERPRAIFVQAQYPVEAAETVARAVGARIVRLDPLAADWLDNIRVMGAALRETAP